MCHITSQKGAIKLTNTLNTFLVANGLMEIIIIILIVQAFICGILSFNLAEHKGQSTGAWFAAGFFFGIFGLIAAAGLPTKAALPSVAGLQKKCPDCAESLLREAMVCKFCGKRFTRDQVVSDFLDALNDKSISSPIQALEFFRTTKEISVIPQLVKFIDTLSIPNYLSLYSYPNGQILSKVIQVLSEIGSPAISPDLVSILRKTSSIPKAVKLIEILGSLRDPVSIPAIIESIQKPELRDPAANSLRQFGQAALSELEKLAKTGKRGDRKFAQQIIADIKSSPLN